MDDSELQSSKAWPEILLTPFGIVMLEIVRLHQKALLPIAVTDDGIIVVRHEAMSVLDSVSIMALQLLRESK